jgi:hypothetical protein
MNPFTRFLNQWTKNRPNLAEFIDHWDTLEALAIGVYKAGEPTDEDEQRYAVARTYMLTHYDNFSGPLKEFWKKSKVGGRLDHADPFEYLFQYESAVGFVGNWAALQHLPAAREALNSYLVQLESA